ncbi:hypothetical protein NKR23_g11929 [Pleurostoma richardsiae]|uniref:Infection structure specific protein n=1 Tax=Pleurostoma richardsiae TaxID=41990 RepID=A0AA38RG32_9PEZI|nr:hypothetical protein NKR23_g11929 [Pleurostoma richardsiae]
MRPRIVFAAVISLASIPTTFASYVAQPRQIPRSDNRNCTAAAYALVTNGVEPSGALELALASFLVTASSAAYCNPATALSSSLQPTYSAYKSGVLSYYSARSTEIAKVESACADNQYVTSLVWLSSVMNGGYCTSYGTPAGTTGTGVAKSKSTPTPSFSVVPVTAAAPFSRGLGLVANAVALAGFLGAVAAF